MSATAGLVEEKEGTAERDAGLAAEALREASMAQGNAEEAALQVRLREEEVGAEDFASSPALTWSG